jgi:hypothetical protein
MKDSGVKVELTKKITLKEFEKLYGHLYMFSDREAKANFIKADYKKAIAEIKD